MPDQSKSLLLSPEGLTPKEIAFCNSYVIDFNETQAVLRLGKLKNPASAAVAANRMLKNVNVVNFIKELTEKKIMTSPQAKKQVSDIASSSINDYLKVVKRTETPRIKVPLKEVIKRKKKQMEFEQRFAMAAGFTGDEMSDHVNDQFRREREILRLTMELKENKKAYRMEDGEPIEVETTQLDLVKLAKNKELGRIKSYKDTAFGVAVELYAADTMLTNILRIHGDFEKDNAQIPAGNVYYGYGKPEDE